MPFLNSDNIIDIGFGGDKIVSHAIGSDLPRPYTNLGSDRNDIPGDIRNGLPIDDNTFDIVYSSHLIEDFHDTASILNEMIRILKDNGRLILMFPDEARYRSCTPKKYINLAHVHDNMGMAFMKNKMSELEKRFGHTVKYIYERDDPNDKYNVILICDIKKK